MMYGRCLRGDATAGTQLRFLQREAATNAVNATQSAPGDGYVFGRMATRRDGGAWGPPADAGGYNAHTWGVESIA